MLASDLMNPAFVGATNPDSLLHAEFYWSNIKTMFGKEVMGEDGKPQRAVYVRIEAPGNDASIIKTPARDDHKKRFPRQWLEFQMKEGLVDEGQEVPGFKIEEWDELNPDQVRELKHMRFSVVEQIAGASDAQVQRMGMNGAALREKAKRALKARWDVSIKNEIEARDREIQELKQAEEKRAQEMKALQEQMSQLLAAVKPQAPAEAPVTVAQPKKHGRKSNAQKAAEAAQQGT